MIASVDTIRSFMICTSLLILVCLNISNAILYKRIGGHAALRNPESSDGCVGSQADLLPDLTQQLLPGVKQPFAEKSLSADL